MKDSQSPPSDRRADALSVGRDAEPSAVREQGGRCDACGGMFAKLSDCGLCGVCQMGEDEQMWEDRDRE